MSDVKEMTTREKRMVAMLKRVLHWHRVMAPSYVDSWARFKESQLLGEIETLIAESEQSK